MKDRKEVIGFLEDKKKSINSKKVTIGIDSAIDKVVRVVRSKSRNNEKEFFPNISQFGEHIISKSGMSCGLELSERFLKLGGNAPITSNALGNLGVKVNCVSPLGIPEINPVFKNLSSNCDLYSIGEPAYTTAMEFEDGKVLLAQVEGLDKVDWEQIKNILGLEKLKSFFEESGLIGLVNWSCMINFNNILEGLLREILRKSKISKEQIVFFDFADFSKRERKEVCRATELIGQFNNYYKVVLGLNENEALLMFKSLFHDTTPEDLLITGRRIFERLNIDSIVIHTLTTSIACDKNSVVQIPSLYVRQPKLSTGGGDNFNAGLCFGLLLGLDLESSLYIANATSGYYVRNAESPTFENLIETLKNWDRLME
ncbi:PfkB family carbohydrate kinase [Clostridium sp.]|uniref:PfkB family carbohydrate kinase n=1 Tax=Clostridium sp. TaxID=1506 RepID=UPI002FC85CD1